MAIVTKNSLLVSQLEIMLNPQQTWSGTTSFNRLVSSQNEQVSPL